MQNRLLIFCIALFAAPTQQQNMQKTRNYEPRIYGGRMSTWKQFPWHAALHNDQGYMCGGALISDRWILTAAHCLKGNPIVEVQLGSIHKNYNNPYKLIIKVNASIVHEKYKPPPDFNDIALLRLSQKVTFSDYVKIISLPSNSLELGTKITLSGFGGLSDRWGSNHILKYVHLIVVWPEVCDIFEETGEGEKCAIGDGAIQSSCSGDSGGPFSANVDNSTVLVGIVSRGVLYSCEKGEPEIFTDVYYYKSWIKSKIDNE